MRKGRKSVLLAGALLLAALLSGCSYGATSESLFTLPRLPIEYTDLSRQINELIAEGYEYASPSSGRNIQSVQMVDLDGDGDEEAVAFFRRSSDERPLKIFIFRARGEIYDKLCVIESSGTAVDSVYYRDLTGNGTLELVVGWRIGSDVQTVAVYTAEAEPTVLMQSSYVRYSIEDLDGDGTPSLLLLRVDSRENNVAEVYSWHGESMAVSYSATLSNTMADLTRGSVVSGWLDEDTPAVFVTGVSEEAVATTDILVCPKGTGLVNVAADRRTGRSSIAFPYMQLRPQDINGDGVIEVPSPCNAPSSPDDGLVMWQQYNRNRQYTPVLHTYHSPSGGWYFVLPQEWWNRADVEIEENVSNEAQTTLLLDGRAAVSIYTLTGENRENRALRGNRLILKRQNGTIYVGEVLAEGRELGLTDDFLRQNFHLVVQQWTSVT